MFRAPVCQTLRRLFSLRVRGFEVGVRVWVVGAFFLERLERWFRPVTEEFARRFAFGAVFPVGVFDNFSSDASEFGN